MCYVCNEVAIDDVAFLSLSLFFPLRSDGNSNGFISMKLAARIDIVKTATLKLLLLFYSFDGFVAFFLHSNPAKPRPGIIFWK